MTGNEILQPILVSVGDHISIRELITMIILTRYDSVAVSHDDGADVDDDGDIHLCYHGDGA